MKKHLTLGLSSILVLSMFAPAAMAEDSFFDVFYDVVAIAQVNIHAELHRPQTLKFTGPIAIRHYGAGDADNDGKMDIMTEILSMDLAGYHPMLGHVSLKKKEETQNGGTAEEWRSNPFPFVKNRLATSFFDVFVELDFMGSPGANAVAFNLPGPGQVLVSLTALHLEGLAKSLTNLSGHYFMKNSVNLGLENKAPMEPPHGEALALQIGEGDTFGVLQFFAINLHSSKSN